MGKQWKQWETFIFLGSKSTADGDCSHDIKRHLLLGRKAMTNLDSILKSRDITLPIKVHLYMGHRCCWSATSPLRPHGLQHARLPCSSPYPGFSQTHVHWVNDTIQPSHPLSSPSPPAFNLSQYRGLFQWVGSLHQVAKAVELQLQHQSFQWIFRVDFI